MRRLAELLKTVLAFCPTLDWQLKLRLENQILNLESDTASFSCFDIFHIESDTVYKVTNLTIAFTFELILLLKCINFLYLNIGKRSTFYLSYLILQFNAKFTTKLEIELTIFALWDAIN